MLAAGPPRPARAELELRTYGLADLLDDLAGSTDAGETAVISWTLWTQTAELALLLADSWLGFRQSGQPGLPSRPDPGTDGGTVTVSQDSGLL